MRRILGAVLLAALLAACAGGQQEEAGGVLRLYTSVSQEPVDAVLAAFADAHPDVEVELFRAPTGELAARLAAERREGEIRADVLWLSDPLSMQPYADEGLLRAWQPDAVEAVPVEYRTDRFVGTHLLEVVAVRRAGVTAPLTSWADLTAPALRGRVAVPDPAFAGSALGALGWFAQAEGYGLDFYRQLADNDAIQVSAPGEVVTGVAEGRFDAGITLDVSAQPAVASGAPIEIVRPEPGAIAVYSPMALLEGADPSAERFAELVLTPDVQRILVDVGGYLPVREDVAAAGGGDRVAPDWAALYERRDELLDAYQAILPA